MKKIMVVLAVLFFASPAFAQDYQAYGLYMPYLPYQLYQLDQSSQPDQSFRFYQPYQLQQQPQNYQTQTAKHSHKRINTNSLSQPVDTK
ncbi:MAG: hypothetical protein ABSE08_10695 [Syntrophobacteraceae bacterium]